MSDEHTTGVLYSFDRMEVPAIAKTVNRMDSYPCDCKMISGAHRHGDCGPMWHAQSWHGEKVAPLIDAAAANNLYGFGFRRDGDGEHTCSVCGVEWGDR